MKKAILGNLILALTATCNIVAAATPCDAWDYARLKDSTQKELVEHACVSQKNKMENISEQFDLIASMTPNSLRDAERIGQIKAVCVDQIRVTMSVHLKKFGKPLVMEECAAPVAK